VSLNSHTSSLRRMSAMPKSPARISAGEYTMRPARSMTPSAPSRPPGRTETTAGAKATITDRMWSRKKIL
jgi:hypothetical protein